MLGKTLTHEFAAAPTTINPHFGTARNPWKLDRITGGSSGGSAAAVAAGLCTFALGSGTGGSIRNPAALCGVVGLQPTHGRTSLLGGLPHVQTFAHFGPLNPTAPPDQPATPRSFCRRSRATIRATRLHATRRSPIMRLTGSAASEASVLSSARTFI